MGWPLELPGALLGLGSVTQIPEGDGTHPGCKATSWELPSEMHVPGVERMLTVIA